MNVARMSGINEEIIAEAETVAEQFETSSRVALMERRKKTQNRNMSFLSSQEQTLLNFLSTHPSISKSDYSQLLSYWKNLQQ